MQISFSTASRVEAPFRKSRSHDIILLPRNVRLISAPAPRSRIEAPNDRQRGPGGLVVVMVVVTRRNVRCTSTRPTQKKTFRFYAQSYIYMFLRAAPSGGATRFIPDGRRTVNDVDLSSRARLSIAGLSLEHYKTDHAVALCPPPLPSLLPRLPLPR